MLDYVKFFLLIFFLLLKAFFVSPKKVTWFLDITPIVLDG